MATSGTLPPPPGLEPWSEKDFAPIMAFLRNQIGITLESHRMGLHAGTPALTSPGRRDSTASRNFTIRCSGSIRRAGARSC